jgi:hypothetical protein
MALSCGYAIWILFFNYWPIYPPGLKLCNPYFLISETNGRNTSMNNSIIRVFLTCEKRDNSFQLSSAEIHICLLFFLYCYFTLYIVVLTLKIDYCLVFISIKFSSLLLSCRFLFLKVKLTYIATEIQLSYPEWIATCIQLKNLEKYLFLLNRNLAKCKE